MILWKMSFQPPTLADDDSISHLSDGRETHPQFIQHSMFYPISPRCKKKEKKFTPLGGGTLWFVFFDGRKLTKISASPLGKKKFSLSRPPSPPPAPREVLFFSIPHPSARSAAGSRSSHASNGPTRPLDHHRPAHCNHWNTDPPVTFRRVERCGSAPSRQAQSRESKAVVWTEVEIMFGLFFPLPLIWAAILLVFTAEYLFCFLVPRRPWITSRRAPNALCTLGEIACPCAK